jgi:ATP-dependent DNA helicase RecQ
VSCSKIRTNSNSIDSEHSGEPGIVYVRTRNRADQIASWLQEKGLPAFSYHAGLDPRIRTERQRRFLHEDGLIIVATIAFGMGIDKPDVRFVAHLDLPASMEAYYQETGRAGRDGQPADAWMVYSLADVVAMRRLQDQSEGDEAFKRIQQRKLEALLGYCEAVECRREALLGYFGETYPAPCPCVYRTDQRFGAAHLTDILVGNPNKRVLHLRHDRLKTFGAGKELSPKEWRSVYRQLLAAGMLSVNIGKISGYRLTEKSWSVLRSERKVRFRKDPQLIKNKKVIKVSPKHTPDFLDDDARQLFEKLRQLRLDLSKKLGVPPFVIFHDKTLTQMAALRPNSRGELLQINGVGEQKAERFGDDFLNAINAGADRSA